MDATGRYATIAGAVETEIEIERSRFICRLERVETEDAARAVIAEVRSEHTRARHHCTAFRLGPRGEVERSNDDGEPSSTAGLPMLDALRGAGLSDVVAVVTRYFGGVLLGTGGLVRAYTASVQSAAAEAGTVHRTLRTRVEIEADYTLGPSLEAELRRLGHPPLGVDYAETMRIALAVPPADVDAFTAKVAELGAGAAQVEVGGTDYVDEPA